MRVLFLALAMACLLASIPAQDLRPLTEDEKILHVLSRLTYGPKPGQFGKVKGMGLDKWLEWQLAPEKISTEQLQKRFTNYKTLGQTPLELSELYKEMQKANPDQMQNLTRLYNLTAQEIRNYIVENAMASEAQLFEVMTDFWRNHFAVDINKDSVKYTTTNYETDVIRKYTMGKFRPFLESTARHPAMLVFLDTTSHENHRASRSSSRSNGSTAARAQAARRRGKPRRSPSSGA